MLPSLTQQGRGSNFGSGRVQRQQNVKKYTSIGVNRIAIFNELKVRMLSQVVRETQNK